MKDKIIELRKLGFSYNEIARRLGCAKSTISYHCLKLKDNELTKKINTDKRDNKTDIVYNIINDDEHSTVINLRNEGKTYNEIQYITKLSLYYISKVCRASNVNKVLEFSELEIKEINKYYDEIGNKRKVAIMFNTTLDIINKFLKIKVVDINKRKKKLVKYVVDFRKRTKIKLVEYKGGKCEKCEYKKCIEALEFHHLNPNEKDFTISGKSWSFDRLKEEVDKCILVCSNCHKEIHYELKKK